MPIGLHYRITQLTPKPTPQNKHSSKEQTVLDIPIKNENAQLIIEIYHKLTKKNCTKSIPYTSVSRICTIVINKNLWKFRQKELLVTIHQR